MKLRTIAENVASIPDSQIYYRVLNATTNEDFFTDDYVDVYRSVQSLKDEEYGSISTFYNVDAIKSTNWMSNIPIEYYLFYNTRANDRNWAKLKKSNVAEIGPEEKEHGLGMLISLQIETTQKFLLDAKKVSLPKNNMNPNFEFPNSEFYKSLDKNLKLRDGTVAPGKLIQTKGTGNIINNTGQTVTMGAKVSDTEPTEPTEPTDDRYDDGYPDDEYPDNGWS